MILGGGGASCCLLVRGETILVVDHFDLMRWGFGKGNGSQGSHACFGSVENWLAVTSAPP